MRDDQSYNGEGGAHPGRTTELTVLDIFRSKAVTLDDIATAVDTVVAGFLVDDYPLAAGWRLNLREAVLADERAAEAVRPRH
jgi:hypothetical protein